MHTVLRHANICTAGPGPAELMQIVARDIQKSRQCRVRLCMRFTPVEAICAVNLDDIKKVAAEVVWPRFKLESGKRFAVAYEHRASTGMDRLAVIKAVADGIKQAKLLGPARTATLLHIRFAEDHGSQKRMVYLRSNMLSFSSIDCVRLLVLYVPP